jgi:hypothetical protein
MMRPFWSHLSVRPAEHSKLNDHSQRSSAHKLNGTRTSKNMMWEGDAKERMLTLRTAVVDLNASAVEQQIALHNGA